MSFALPIGFTLAALALPIVALYILKVRLRRVPVSTNLFWKQIYAEKPPRSIWQHLRYLFSLLLQLFMLLVLVLAIADPYFSWQLSEARRVVLVIDNSASMGAADVSPSRFKAALAAAHDLVEGLRFRDEMAIVIAGNSPEVAIGMTGHAPTLRAAIGAIRISDASTSLRDAIRLGRQLIGQHPHGQIIVLTDGAVDENPGAGDLPDDDAAGGSASIPPDNSASSDRAGATKPLFGQETRAAPVEFRIFATEADNVGITQLQVRRSLIDPAGYEILAAVRNASSQTIVCRLELTLDEIPVDIIPLSMKPNELWSGSFQKTSLTGGRIKAELTHIVSSDAEPSGSQAPPGLSTGDLGLNPALVTGAVLRSKPDMLATDNTAWALLPERRMQRVLIVTAGNLFLQKVFEANPLVEVTTRKDLPTARDWPTDSIIVLHGSVPATLPSGNVFVVDPTGSCDQWDLSDLIENPIVADQDTTSMLMNHIRLDNVVVPEAKRLNFKSPIHPLATTLNGDVVYSDVRRPNGKCLVLSINLDRGDLAFRTAFPILVANALNWFAATSGDLQPAIAAGSVTALRLEAAALHSRPPLLLSPSGQLTPVGIDKASEFQAAAATMDSIGPGANVPVEAAFSDRQAVTIGPLNEVGVWALVNNQTASTTRSTKPTAETINYEVLAEVAVNLASERETDLRPLKQLDQSTPAPAFTTGWLNRPSWFYLVVVALLLTCVEWFLYQRRFIS